MRHLLVIKLAAIGDVTIATQALASRGGALKSGSWTVHWILDHGLVPIALHEELGLPWYYGIIAALFRGKVRQIGSYAWLPLCVLSAQMAAVLPRRPMRLLEWRGPGDHAKEDRSGPAPWALFERLGLVADLLKRSASWQPQKNCRRKLRIGILVGGAATESAVPQTWPHFGDLALILARSGRYEISLFGASEDRAAADNHGR